MKPESHALVVSAEGEASEAWFFRPGIFGLTAKFANSQDSCLDVRDTEEYVDATVFVIAVQPAVYATRFEPGLPTLAHRVRSPAQESLVELLCAHRVGHSDLEEGRFASHREFLSAGRA